jgi:hypothetical protein
MNFPSYNSVKRAALALLLVPVLVYLCDFILIRFKVEFQGRAATLGSVQYLQAVQLKNGKTEVYYGDPQTEVCAHSVFPQYGHRPCWYASREPVHVIGADGQPMFLPDMRKTY